MKIKTFGLFVIASLLVGACGGGSSSSGNNSSSTSSNNLSITATPTAKLASSQTNAASLAGEFQQQAPKVVAAASVQTVTLALGTLPSGSASGTFQCSGITGIGTGSISYAYSFSNPPVVGNAGSVTFDPCEFTYNGVTYTFRGATSLTYTRYNSSADYAVLYSYSGISLSATGGAADYQYGPETGSFTLDVSNSGSPTYTIHLSDGSVTNLYTSNVSYTGTDVMILNGTYVYNSPAAGGIIRVDFNHWTYDSTTGKPVSGTVTITGANGATVTIAASGSTYTVSYSDGNSFTVTY